VPRAPTRGYHHGHLRERLLAIATTELDAGRTLELSLREIARQAGVSAASVYHHFRDKESLVAAVCEESFVALDRAVEAAQSQTRPGRAQLERMFSAYVAFARAHPGRYRAMFRREVADAERFPGLHEAGRRSFERLTAAVAAAGPRRSSEAHLLGAMVLWSGAHGVADLANEGALLLAPGAEGEAERLMQAITASLVGAALGPARPRRS